MTRPQAPLGVLLLRLIIPFAVLLGYWLFRLPRLTGEHAGDSATAVEWVLAIAGTLVGIGVMVDAGWKLFNRLAPHPDEDLVDEADEPKHRRAS
ncbi:hypothetical protein ACFWMR_01975 [Amycolatopsis thailandensis]|uniref:hypothetical protein n=1 Tax=Amycolatopsis thailandensis TaxID=589330 RepID=UPI00364F65C8